MSEDFILEIPVAMAMYQERISEPTLRYIYLPTYSRSLHGQVRMTVFSPSMATYA